MITKAKITQPDVRPHGNQKDIPESIDAFLRILARWAVEEVRRGH